MISTLPLDPRFHRVLRGTAHLGFHDMYSGPKMRGMPVSVRTLTSDSMGHEVYPLVAFCVQDPKESCGAISTISSGDHAS